MKNKIIIIALLLLTTVGFSQGKKEKIQALKIAQITETLDLSENEAQKFWPFYNAFEDSIKSIKNDIRKIRKSIDFETISESESREIIKEITVLNDQKHNLYNNYVSDLQKVLPARKVLLLKKSEEEFKRKMFDEYKKRKQKRP
jgi:hypothetical protein